ncbi:uncharacterized protein OCT59_017945 [Rhizophagus irregularis]|uniref:uncharacterized protein n=1 Tax=Rhizophagus irregularis TaxID=588596 RepID=UPI0033202C9A|nr:hypothetical protein OCT59_017945 [Rhizophagus irregularis]
MVSFKVRLPLQADRSIFHYRIDRFPPCDFIGWADFPLRTLLDGRVLDGQVSIIEFAGFPSDFIRSGFLRTFIRLGENDG